MNRVPPILSAAVLILLTVAVYFPTFEGGFIWDDNVLITQNPAIQARDGFYRAWLVGGGEDYYPLTRMLRWLQWQLWGNHAPGYHMVNVLLHALNAVGVWIILTRLRIPGAWWAGLVFAVHPVNVATAAWISEQKTTLSMFWCVVSILLYLKFAEENRRCWYLCSLGVFLLALLSKIAVVTLPVVLLACVWWRRGKLRGRDVLDVAPFFGLSLVLGMICARAMEGSALPLNSSLSRVITAGWVPWFYLGKALWPVNLMVIYPKWEIDPASILSYVPGVVLLSCFAVLWWKRESWGRPLLFALGCFLAMLFPILGLLDQGFYQYSFVADHWQYYAIVGPIALAMAAGVDPIWKSKSVWRTGVGIAMLGILAATALMRSRLYADQQQLWRNNLTKNPAAWLVRNNLGFSLQHAGQLEAAITEYREALRLKPDYADAHNNLGVALTRLGYLPAAMEHYRQALRFRPYYAEAHYNLGIALWQTGNLDDAIRQYEEALKMRPGHVECRDNLAVALVQRGRIEDAIQHWEEALRIEPNYAQAHYNLALTLERLGKLRDAAEHYGRALQIKPDFGEARENLSRLQAAQ